MSPKPAGADSLPFVLCAVTSCFCFYVLEHNLNAALNVWEVTVG